MLVDFESDWFKSYCKAVLESEPNAMHANVKNALDCIHQRLRSARLTSQEREAMEAAVRNLLMIDDADIRQAS